MSEITNSESSSVDRFFSADLNLEQLDAKEQAVSRVFEQQDYPDLKVSEREKTPDERKIIGLCNDSLNHLRTGFGLPPFNIPEKNIHIIKAAQWPDSKGAALFVLPNQGIMVREEGSMLMTAARLYHEMAHFSSYGALEFSADQVADSRVGLSVRTRPDQTKHLTLLNEAVTAELTKQFVQSLYSHPLFENEHQRTEEIRQKHADELAFDGSRLFTEDTYYAETSPSPRGGDFISVGTTTYHEARQALNSLCTDLGQRYDLDHQTIFRNFVRSYFDGNLLTLGKVIDTAYGRGTFRHLGEQKTEPELLETVRNITAKR